MGRNTGRIDAPQGWAGHFGVLYRQLHRTHAQSRPPRNTPSMFLASLTGEVRLAYKLLVNDRAKFAALLVGITFAVFLMIEMTSHVRRRSCKRSSATVINIGAKIWVMDPAVKTVANTHPDARLRAGRGAQHPRREIRRAALLGRRPGRSCTTAPTRRSRSSASTTPACSAGPQLLEGQDRGHLRRERLHRRARTRSSTSSSNPDDRHRVRAQRPPRP